MNVSRAYVSADPRRPWDRPGPLLIVGVNWLGDAVMTMPALRALRQAAAGRRIVIMVKDPLADLWRMARDMVDDVLAVSGNAWQSSRAVRTLAPSAAIILPHSFRSGLIPWLARVPVRVGMPGHSRDWMLTTRVAPRGGLDRTHQVYEYFDLMGLEYSGAMVSPPLMRPPDVVRSSDLARTIGRLVPAVQPGRIIGIVPGAARGPSKRWPASRFIEVGRQLARRTGWPILVFGGGVEGEACDMVAQGIGAGATSIAGQTNLVDFAVLLAQCGVVIANDSGGMHLAAAVGAPVVGIFGLTDPDVTGPIGPRARVVRPAGVTGQRAIGRDSDAARAALSTIAPEAVYDAACDLLEQKY